MTITHADPLKVILVSTLIGAIALELLLVSSIYFGNNSAIIRSLSGIAAIAYILLSIAMYKQGHLAIAGWMITTFYFLIGAITAFIWGINAPVAILVLSFSLLLSALVLPIRYIFINTSVVVATLAINQLLVSAAVLRPITQGLAAPSTYADLFIYTIMYAMFAVLIWLFAMRIKSAFEELTHSKEIIERQNRRISQELRLEKKRLRLTEIAKTSQLAAFSEIGQYTSLLMHDLSNELAILKMRDETEKSPDFKETSRIIDEIERLIERSRRALIHKTETKPIKSLMNEIADNFQYYSDISKVHIKVETRDNQVRLTNAHLVYQVLSIIVKNAIDAYASQPIQASKEINITCYVDGGEVVLIVQDWAGGISGYKDSRVFSGLQSTKKNGHGIGLHLCQLIVKEQLNGTIDYKNKAGSSLFTLTLPLN